MNSKSSGYAANHHAAARAKKNWEGILMVMLLQAKVPKELAWVHASMELRFPSRRTRDEGNFRMLIEKALGDTLQQGGYLPDDGPQHYRFTEVTFDPEKGPKQMTIRLTYELAGTE
jgi:hypothetical protein